MEAKAIQTDSYLKVEEIHKHLENVEMIVMASPAPEKFKTTPIHFTVFLNTSDKLPAEIQKSVLEKFLTENKISKPAELLSKLMPIGFGVSPGQDTLMPMLLVNPKDQASIPYEIMFVMDFLADSDEFNEAKIDSLTGWSYSYN